MNIEELKQKLIEKSPEQFREKIITAIKLAEKYHTGQSRYSGDPFITHPLKTGFNLANMELDSATICAGILHNTVTNLPAQKEEIYEQITREIGIEVTELIKKNNEINKATANPETDHEIMTKFILNNNKDLRPILIKLADTLDNVRAIEYMPEERLNSKVQKIFKVYGPLAEYLELGHIKTELEEKALEIYRPEEYKTISKRLTEEGITQEVKDKYCEYFTQLFKEQNPKIEGRIKSKYSIYRKLKKQIKEGEKFSLTQIMDLIGFRIVLKTEEQCFTVLEKIMDNAEIISEEFDDYISNPKPNGYMAIQGPMLFPEISNNLVEVQILTEEMHYTNTYGTASHIAYKESKSRYAQPTDKYDWVEQVHLAMENNKKNRETEFSIPIISNIFPNNAFAFTPKGKIIALTKGDTVLDFAFKVHTGIGNSMVGAKVNGLPVKLDYIVSTGETIEIKTDNNKKNCKPEWVKYANSPSTKYHLQRTWKKQQL